MMKFIYFSRVYGVHLFFEENLFFQRGVGLIDFVLVFLEISDCKFKFVALEGELALFFSDGLG